VFYLPLCICQPSYMNAELSCNRSNPLARGEGHAAVGRLLRSNVGISVSTPFNLRNKIQMKRSLEMMLRLNPQQPR